MRDVPAAYAAAFVGARAVLDSHRGWDPGAWELARQMAHTLGVPMHAGAATRLLIDLNRSIGHPQLYSEFTRGLPRAERHAIVQQHYAPYRDAVERDVAQRIARGEHVIHIASHSFTPVWHGVTRRADVAWLYDPRRGPEVQLAKRWMAQLARRDPGLQLRRNYPYQGRSDGLESSLRKRYAPQDYLGIELEVNQCWVAQGGTAWSRLRTDLVDALADALAQRTAGPPGADPHATAA